jgi:hypothetical protein
MILSPKMKTFTTQIEEIDEAEGREYQFLPNSAIRNPLFNNFINFFDTFQYFKPDLNGLHNSNTSSQILF